MKRFSASRFLKIIFPCLILSTVAGCRTMNVEEVAARLRVGMSKAEMDGVMKGQKLLKEQTVSLYKNSTEVQTMSAVWNDHTYKFVYPEELVTKQLTFDGDLKVYSYLIKEEKSFAVPVVIHYLAVFYSQKEGKVIGWAQMEKMGEARTWTDKF